MKPSVIRVVNARQHNLKGISVEIPRRALVVVTGPSGSGKSSLAFDTLYAEGQRRYIESLSTYAKQFLERMPKPLVDRLEGVSPSVAIEQRPPSASARSTVGTATEAYDYLRLLWARVGTQHCVGCGAIVARDTPESATERTVSTGGRIQVAFPLPPSARKSTQSTVENLSALGFVRVLVDGTAHRLDELPSRLNLSKVRELLVVVDRISADIGSTGRLTESLSTAFNEGEGVAIVLLESGARLRFTEFPACSECDTPSPVVTPALFSFNNPRGACTTCNGFGAILEYAERLIVPDPERSVQEGAIDPWTKPRYDTQRRRVVEALRELGGDPKAPWSKLDTGIRNQLLHGKVGRYVGIFEFLRRLEKKRYKQYIRIFLRQYQLANECSTCHGSRLKPEVSAVKVAGRSIAEIAALTVDEICNWLAGLELEPSAQQIASAVLGHLSARLDYLRDVGLGYLSLTRQSRTLSGGEAQRIALGNALSAQLVDSLYVLDEPSIGLHPRDTERLLILLERLRDLGNTVVVVEHDPEVIRRADWMLELGPGAGQAGGQVVHSGRVGDAGDTLTAQYLTGKKRIGVPSLRRPVNGMSLTVRGATFHNLKAIDVTIPLGTMTAITGVSGSGKSTLVHDIIRPQLARRLEGSDGTKAYLGEQAGHLDSLEGWKNLESVVVIDQSPIGRNPRSNPVTYIKAFDEIRKLYASQPLSRKRKYTAGTFSFNTVGGRCKECDGAGHIQIEMVFLADVYVPCEVCQGSRYSREVLDVKIDGVSIADTLNWSVDEAIQRFHHQPKLGAALWQLQQVGLGYLKLGQPATTLSGGEAQRLKIARELLSGQKKKGRKLYLLDEPTTGLHLDDVRTLIAVIDKLVGAGNTVVIIEHHLDVIKRADWVIDLGPEAGENGGEVVAMGTPETVAKKSRSHTGRYLSEVLGDV